MDLGLEYRGRALLPHLLAWAKAHLLSFAVVDASAGVLRRSVRTVLWNEEIPAKNPRAYP
jgi:hypothetical protein